MSFINWIIDSLATEDVIDSYIIMSDLVDLKGTITESETQQRSDFDSRASAAVGQRQADSDGTPNGKRVI
jgi:hypothetical protein